MFKSEGTPPVIVLPRISQPVFEKNRAELQTPEAAHHRYATLAADNQAMIESAMTLATTHEAGYLIYKDPSCAPAVRTHMNVVYALLHEQMATDHEEIDSLNALAGLPLRTASVVPVFLSNTTPNLSVGDYNPHQVTQSVEEHDPLMHAAIEGGLWRPEDDAAAHAAWAASMALYGLVNRFQADRLPPLDQMVSREQ